MNEKLLSISEEIRISAVRLLISIAVADGIVTDEEEFFIDRIKNISLSDDVKAILEDDFKHPKKLEDILVDIPDMSVKLSLLQDGLTLATLDGIYDEAEKKVIAKLSNVWGIAPEKLAALEKWVLDGIEWEKKGERLVNEPDYIG